ncbi:GH3 auxin-responsive promoter family protein [Aporhodopirellula aestuarii]|uniref:GH3 auxin-responsive promoter family protein n=1 Tax=Aporhodopirellula aestuarii TaxID=2950107 RepID=A0ABT0TX10_9BACT|nr:GH3 auxin-responsive promoter family protein [Aporhodopirellula aestuarii]MCM2369153.1 GH3 auxin-responsive promoter family protein [Aporhodopirellula aestuarii]
MHSISHYVRLAYLQWRLRRLTRYLRGTADCQSVQRSRLMEKIRLNEDSQFGREHGFASIRSVEDFRSRVPIANYETYRPYIEEVKNGNSGALFGPGTQVLMFSMTSGTTSQSKYVPITNHFFEEYRRSWNYWGLATYRDHNDLLSKQTLTLTSDWDQFRTNAGIPCGSISGLAAETRPRITNSLFILPNALLKVKGTENKQYASLRVAIESPQIGMIATANPLTLIHLARMADEQKERLIRDVHNGTLSDHVEIPAEVRQVLKQRSKGANRSRAKELDNIVERTGHLHPKDFWPGLSVVSVWMGGSVAAYLPTVRQYYGDVPLRDHGLSASEGHMTSPMQDETCAGLLDYESHFFEFIPTEEHGTPDPTVLEAHELEVGQEYFLLMSTLSGLYRYDIHDVVRCDGFIGRCPQLTFLNKGAHYSSMTGEKLSELQVTQAIGQAFQDCGLSIDHYSLVPVPGDPAHYRLLVEESFDSEKARQIAASVDQRLSEVNCEYEDRLQGRRMAGVVVATVPPGTWTAHRQRQTAGEGNDTYAYKHPFLAAKPELAEQFRTLSDNGVIES